MQWNQMSTLLGKITVTVGKASRNRDIVIRFFL